MSVSAHRARGPLPGRGARVNKRKDCVTVKIIFLPRRVSSLYLFHHHFSRASLARSPYFISMRRVEHSWSEVRDAQWESLAEIRDDAGALRELFEKTSVGDNIALLDRNSLAAMDWRKVFAHRHSRHSETAWVLCNEHGNVIDEPDQGCPREEVATRNAMHARGA